MAEQKITTDTVQTVSDGVVKISIEKYEELVAKAAEKAPVINKTVVKTAEMLAQENKAWGGTFMAVGAVMFAVGALRFKAGRSAS